MHCLKIAVWTALFAFACSAVSATGRDSLADNEQEAPASDVLPTSLSASAHLAKDSKDWPALGWKKQNNNFLQMRYKNAAESYEREWSRLPQFPLVSGSKLSEGATGARVVALRRRLGLLSSYLYDAELGDRVSLYRDAHGLPQGRHLDAEMVASLNLGYSVHRRVIETNLHRLSALPGKLGERFLIVDTAKQMLYQFEGTDSVGSMRVVVGREKYQTPYVASKLDHVVLNPYWNVPPDLTRDQYAGRIISGGKNYLTTRRFEALSSWDDDARVLSHGEVDWRAVQRGDLNLRLRQRPGPGNGMGEIKFMFPNDYGVYLHDTPSKQLFAKDKRLFSAGCVRLEKPWELAQWLFGARPKANSSEPEQKVYLRKAVPVYLVYLTAAPNGTGFDFREDVYSKDASNKTALR